MPTTPESGAELFSAYLDAELDDAESEAVRQMLEASEDARTEFEELRQLVALVGTLPSVEAPEDFYEKLNRRLRHRQLLDPQGSSKLAMIAISFQVLSIIVILVVAAMYMMSELDKTPTSLERDPAALDGDADLPRKVQE